ncbi:DUF6263 family protein [Mucilaginibacter antarcticus]|uniref:DUF6263 family protein n=1 Tax=Mucilaginibacter antarcticus TaxID=1855725 RepID=A0ABW5XP19_9SPHI
MKTSNLWLVIFAATFIYSCNGGDKVLLRLKLNLNKKIDLKYRTLEFAENENGSPLKTEYIRMTMRVDRIMPDSAYQFLAKCDFIRITNPGLLADEEYTSDKDISQLSEAGRHLDEQLAPAIDSLYQFTINKQGKIVKPISFAGGKAISPEYALINLNIFQINFPVNAVGVGEEWSNESDLPGSIYKRKSTYKIESIYDSTVQISVDGKIDGAKADSKSFAGRYYLNKETNNLDSCKLEIKDADKRLTVIALAAK